MDAPPTPVADLHVETGHDGARFLVGRLNARIEDESAIAIRCDRATGRFELFVFGPSELERVRQLVAFVTVDDADENERRHVVDRLEVHPRRKRKRTPK